ncbi:hypothetical protein [Synechococcus phage S-N03]|uniref:Tail fiber protein n=1 Tax=Synechococcus phage S-N03 TaxID=2718943 RepID=A0A6G8R668_9CAUD|nr:tail fiber protein [Synechococcus phage S-N03]QIN96874.1 hypothetical protein [Synechococcus phage S-N03]
MAIVNFPANPTIGDQYNENGITYTWNGAAWTANGAENTDARYVQVTGDTMTGSLNVPSLNSGPLAGFRNALVNGDFRIWQRGTTGTAGGSAEYVSVDRWLASAGVAINQQTAAATPTDVASYAALISRVGGGNITQAVELERTGRCGPFTQTSQWTVSIWSNGATAPTVGLSFADNAINQNSVAAGGGNQVMTSTGETSNNTTVGTYTRYEATFTINADPGANNTCLNVIFIFADDSTRICNAQLEPGPVATPFEIRPLSTELSLCQRYAYRIESSSSTVYTRFGGGVADGSSSLTALVQFPVTMRSIPNSITSASSGNFQASNGVVGQIGTNLTLQTSTRSKTSSIINLAVGGGLTSGNYYFLEAASNNNAWIIFEAEL